MQGSRVVSGRASGAETSGTTGLGDFRQDRLQCMSARGVASLTTLQNALAQVYLSVFPRIYSIMYSLSIHSADPA